MARRARNTPPPSRASAAALRPFVFAIVLAAIVTWAYSTSFKGVFVYDDGVAIAENPNIRSLWPLTRALSAPPESPVSARPVAALTLALNYALAPADVRDVMTQPAHPASTVDVQRFQRNVSGYHAMNLLLHLAAALAIAGVIRRTLLTPALRERFGDAATPLAFAAATLWAVHPLTTDAVTYIVQRTEVLMGLCFALTLYCAIRAGDASPPAAARLWITGAIIACATGMGSKQTMVTAPVVVWLWDWIFLSAEKRGRSRWPLYGGLAATWLLLGALVAYERWPTSIGFALDGWTPWTYLLTQTSVIAHYVRLAVTGTPQALDYDGWPMTRSIVAALPFALPLSGALVVTIAGVLRRRAWAFPLVVWFAALAPSSSILPLATEIAAERRMYVPLAALAALVIAGIYIAARRYLRANAARWAAGAAAVALIAAYGSLTFARNQDFSSSELIWQDTVSKRPTNPRARLNYGVVLAEAGRAREAEGQLREALRLKERSAPAHFNLGAVLASTDRPEEGVQHFERALAIDPTYTSAYSNLGEAYGALGNRALAAKYFGLAVDVTPDDPFLLNRLGWLLATSPESGIRDGAKAVTLAQRAVRLTNNQDAASLDTLAAAYAEVDRFEDAVHAAGEAIDVAGRHNQADLLQELKSRLVLFQAHQKYREAAR